MGRRSSVTGCGSGLPGERARPKGSRVSGGEEPCRGPFRAPEGGESAPGCGRAGRLSAARPVAYLPAPRLPAEAAAAMLLWG